MANNTPGLRRSELEYYCMLGRVPIIHYDGTNNDLGRDSVCSYQEFTKVEHLVNNSHDTETQKISVIQAKLIFSKPISGF